MVNHSLTSSLWNFSVWRMNHFGFSLSCCLVYIYPSGNNPFLVSEPTSDPNQIKLTSFLIMANNPIMHPIFTVSLPFFIFFLLTFPATGEEQIFGKQIDRESLGLKIEKASHFRWYWHDVLSGTKPTSIEIIPAANSSSSSMTGFGGTNIIDNPLTVGPDLGSKCVGRAQGIYASAGQADLGLLMVMNLAFIEGKYNGSTLTVVGRNPAFNKVREMPIVGGSGLFRFARGYVEARTHWVNITTGDATVRYDAYVLHY